MSTLSRRITSLAPSIARTYTINTMPRVSVTPAFCRGVYASRFFSNGPQEQTNQQTQPNKTAAASAEASAEAPKTAAALEGLTAKIAELEIKIDEMKHENLIVLADRENTRRIAKKDVADAKLFGIQSFAKSLLDTEDNLMRALDAVPKDQVNSNPHLKSLFEGVTMTEKLFMKILQEHGVEKINPLGEKFNPMMHEAVFEIPDGTKEAGTVGVVAKEGFALKGRPLRPATVGVYVKPPAQS